MVTENKARGTSWSPLRGRSNRRQRFGENLRTTERQAPSSQGGGGTMGRVWRGALGLSECCTRNAQFIVCQRQVERCVSRVQSRQRRGSGTQCEYAQPCRRAQPCRSTLEPAVGKARCYSARGYMEARHGCRRCCRNRSAAAQRARGEAKVGEQKVGR